MKSERTRLLGVKLTEAEMAMVKALAGVGAESTSTTVRRWIKTFYRERFGDEVPGVKVGGDR